MSKRGQSTQVRDVVAAYLRHQNARYVFGVPGSYILGFYDAVHGTEGLDTILTKNELGAGIMADGYARIAGTLACCASTAGPGATNLLTGVGCAYMSSQPVFVFTGQVPTTYFGKGCLQEGTGIGRTIDQSAIFAAATKFQHRVIDPETIESTVRTAIASALSGRPGPVNVEIPIDVLNSPAPAPTLDPIEIPVPAASADDIERAAVALRGAKRPAILAGAGALHGGAAPELLELVERLAAPIATTLKAKGIVPEDHPLALGCAGLFGTSVANAYLRDHTDVLLAVGASFHEFTSQCYDPDLQPKTALIQADIDPDQIGRNYDVSVGLVGSAKANLRMLLEALGPPDGEPPAAPREVARLKKKYRYFNEKAARDDSSPIKPAYMMTCLRRCLPRDAIVFSESITWSERYLPCYGPFTHMSGTGLAPIGYSFPASIGAQVAAPNRKVVGMGGDGGFQFTAIEFLTAVNYGIPIKMIILDNSRFGSIYDAQTFLYRGRHEVAEFRNPDFVAMARSFGARGVRIEDPAGLEDQLRSALALDGPVLIDVVTDPDTRPPFKPASLRRTRAWNAPLPDTRSGTKAVFEMLKER